MDVGTCSPCFRKRCCPMVFQSEVLTPEANLKICRTISFRNLAIWISTCGGLVNFPLRDPCLPNTPDTRPSILDLAERLRSDGSSWGCMRTLERWCMKQSWRILSGVTPLSVCPIQLLINYPPSSRKETAYTFRILSQVSFLASCEKRNHATTTCV